MNFSEGKAQTQINHIVPHPKLAIANSEPLSGTEQRRILGCKDLHGVEP